nr:adhesion G-protein coupled receptor G2 [Crassostrea gigas]
MNTLYDYDLFDHLPDGSARICAADFNVGTKPVTRNQDSKNLLSKLTIILNCISIICLMITFLIYVSKKKLRTMPGKMNMILIFSLFLTLVVFQLSKFGSTEKWACIGFGIAIHYFWLVSFSSMTASSFHMFRIFRFSQICNTNHSNGLLKIYIVSVSIFPCVVVVLNIVISWILSGKEDVGYGNKICFIDNKFLRLATFTIPVCLMCLLNLLFFVITIISIRKVPNVPENKSIRSEFRIFCRLFTITGIPWVLQIIDGYLPFSTFSYVTTVINSLQGTAIFAAFVLNKRVIRILWKSCKLSRNGNSDTTVETNTDDTKL